VGTVYPLFEIAASARSCIRPCVESRGIGSLTRGRDWPLVLFSEKRHTRPARLGSASRGSKLDPKRTYSAWADATQCSASLDQQLFFELSELSLRRYADCTRYHIELCFLLTSIARGEAIRLRVAHSACGTCVHAAA
jgi:hypothetical protein